MGERLTKEREAEIREATEAAPCSYVGRCNSTRCPKHGLDAVARRDLLAELDALRAAPPTTYLHADGTEEPIGELVARLTRERDEALTRVRGLEAEREAMLVAASEAVGDDRGMDAYTAAEAIRAVVKSVVVERDEARATLAETRAQLARLREAADALCGELTTDRLPDGGTRWQEALALRDALSTPGPTLAEIEREAQVKVLREMRDRVSDQATNSGHGIAGDVLRGVAAQIHQLADDIEAGRG